MRPTNLKYTGQQSQFEDLMLSPSIGGHVLQFTANNPLNIGDCVVIVAQNTVDKSTVAANLSKVIGVVVGGAALNDQGITELQQLDTLANVVGTPATTAAGQLVYVAPFGVLPVVADGAISIGQGIKLSGGTAGRVVAATAGLTIAVGGTAVTSTAANGAIISGDSTAATVFGLVVGPATVNPGDITLAFINI